MKDAIDRNLNIVTRDTDKLRNVHEKTKLQGRDGLVVSTAKDAIGRIPKIKQY